MEINTAVDRAHAYAVKKGFYDGKDANDVHFLLGRLMLVVTEVAEAAQEVCKGNMNREKYEEELADICIRVFDLAGASRINLAKRILDKMAINEKRPHMHGKRA